VSGSCTGHCRDGDGFGCRTAPCGRLILCDRGVWRGVLHAGLDALWKLYHAPHHTLTKGEIEREFGLLEDHFGLYCRRVAEELGANDPDPLPLVTSSQDEYGNKMITLKPSVVMAIKSYAFSK
jgi:hypothetical protein